MPLTEDAPRPSSQLKRRLLLRDLVLYGIVIIQPTAPMPIFGVISQTARGHVVTTILIAMIAMLFTAVSYGRMAQLYPSAGSAYTYVSREIHPGLGFLVGWSVMLDYLLNPLICTIWCSKAIGNFFPFVPYSAWVVGFVLLFTFLNLRGIETSARINLWMCVVLSAVVLIFLGYATHYILVTPHPVSSFLQPFYDPRTFSLGAVSSGTAVAVLTYIGFDAVSTLSEEAEHPKTDILRATVLTCLITGVLASLEVYAAQLAWPDWMHYPDVDTAFVWVAQRVGGHALYGLMNLSIIVATIGSGFASQLAAARLLYGMGRDRVLPQRFFSSLNAQSIPQNNVLLSAGVALIGALILSYGTGAELLNFGAFIAFMGVNASALVYARRQKISVARRSIVPLLGGLVCAYIWFNLSRPAKIAGFVWLACGIAYGAWRGVLTPAVVPGTGAEI